MRTVRRVVVVALLRSWLAHDQVLTEIRLQERLLVVNTLCDCCNRLLALPELRTDVARETSQPLEVLNLALDCNPVELAQRAPAYTALLCESMLVLVLLWQ